MRRSEGRSTMSNARQQQLVLAARLLMALLLGTWGAHHWGLEGALLMGWVGLPGTLLSGAWAALPLCFVASISPRCYVLARRRLHRSGRLRCDWLTAL